MKQFYSPSADESLSGRALLTAAVTKRVRKGTKDGEFLVDGEKGTHDSIHSAQASIEKNITERVGSLLKKDDDSTKKPDAPKKISQAIHNRVLALVSFF